MTDWRLLILDDDSLTGETLRRIAEAAGFDARCSTSARRFFDQMESWRPHVIIVDLIMPNMDGVQVMTELAQRGCRAALIISSGVGSRVLDAARRSAEEHGLHIAGILPKPFLPAALRELLTMAARQAVALAGDAGPMPPAAPLPSDTSLAAEAAPLSRADLERGLGQQELFLVYQPKLHCRSGALAGFEALVRWRHPTLGVLDPERFLPLAEGTSLMDELTRVVFGQALAWFAAQCHPPAEAARVLSYQTRSSMTLSLNVSAESLVNAPLFDWLEGRCHELSLPLERIILELTETSAMRDPVASLDLLTRLRIKGFQLSIDDFGTGYSSMLQLVRLPFSEIKVDQSFVRTAEQSAESRSVVRSVVDLGRSLGLKSTAEGVEDEATLGYLRRIGSDLAQGYHIARPMAGAEVIAWAGSHDASQETLRLQALHALDILDSDTEPRFDRLTRLAQQVFRVPIALVTLVDADRQWFKSRTGTDLRETSRDISFCTHAIHGEDVMVVPDTLEDERFRDNPLVLGVPHVRFYAGRPLRIGDGSTVGTLCLMDTVPRALDADGRDMLHALAALVEKELAVGATAINDPLTQLLTRRSFESRARDALALAARLRQPTALLLFELDSLPAVNHRFGREQGDQALALLGETLRATFPHHDLSGRLGGNEFAVLLGEADRAGAKRALERLQAALDASAQTQGLEYRLRLTCGMADSHGGKDLQALLAEADAARIRIRAQAIPDRGDRIDRSGPSQTHRTS